jgi:hypothetical protein
VGLGKRPTSAVPAVADLMKDMIVPITIVTARDSAGARIDRSAHYLIDELDHLYQNKAHTLPSWSKWASEVRQFSPLAQQALDGKVNLHEHLDLIEAMAVTYQALQREAAQAKLTPS